jgi:hypothetical protein
MKRRVYETVARKRACEGPQEPAEAAVERQIGSKGWHTRGYLPHYYKPGLMEMLTFRLADATPASRRQEWEVLFQRDRYIRDEGHFGKARRYIESNPVKAGLTPEATAWPWSSANPKWRWSSPDRFHRGHLVHADGERLPEWGADRSADILVRPAQEKKEKESYEDRA